MSTEVDYVVNKASAATIAEHLSRCDTDFVPPLRDRVEIVDYAKQIADKAMRFEAWSGSTLVGLVAAYCNDHERSAAYITSVSVLKAWTGKGIATRLINQCVEYARASGMRRIGLEVAGDNPSAMRLYEGIGFSAVDMTGQFVTMNLCIGRREAHDQRA